jgi:hypothetical protein
VATDPMTSAARRPRWWGWVGTAAALYGLVLLAVFVSWHAAIIGCLIASGASEATRART